MVSESSSKQISPCHRVLDTTSRTTWLSSPLILGKSADDAYLSAQVNIIIHPHRYSHQKHLEVPIEGLLRVELF